MGCGPVGLRISAAAGVSGCGFRGPWLRKFGLFPPPQRFFFLLRGYLISRRGGQIDMCPNNRGDRRRPTSAKWSARPLAGGGGSWGGGGGVLAARPGGGPRGGGVLRATHYYHMHTSMVCVCLGAWGYRGMCAIIAISRLFQEERVLRTKVIIPPSTKHGTWRRWHHGPRTAICQNWGGRGLGGSQTRTGPGHPPVASSQRRERAQHLPFVWL